MYNNSQHQSKKNPVNIETDDITLDQIVLKLKTWYKYLLSQWTLILIGAAVGAGIGFTNAYFKRPIYKAELSFLLEEAQSDGGLGSYSGLASMVGINVNGGTGGMFSGNNLIELMQSREVIVKALLRPVSINSKIQTLAEYYIQINDLRHAWKDNPILLGLRFDSNLDRAKFGRLQDSVMGSFYRDLKAGTFSVMKKDENLSIVTVTVDSENQVFAKYFAEAIVETVSQFYIETKIKKSAENLYVLQHQTDSVRRALNSAMVGAAVLSDNNPNGNLARQILRVPSQNRQVDVQVNTLILGELVKNLELAKMSLRKDTPFIQIIDKPIFPLQKSIASKVMGLVLGAITAIILLALLLLLTRKSN